MALALLCLGLTLLGALQTQAQDSARSLIPAPSLASIPLEQYFEEDQFQGKWYVVGLAGNKVWKKARKSIKMYSIIYKLEADHSYSVTSTRLSKKGCKRTIRSLVPGSRPGRFHLRSIKYYPNIWSFTAQVIGTTYKGMALMYVTKTVGNKEYFRLYLYSGTKVLPLAQKEFFIKYAKLLGLTDNNVIFTTPVDRCIDA